ncbi:MAG TPA: hypothetical protein DEB39_13720 [Planctomycetaceae bacterium]|nr:hypothetical protein [Planctomycetaceae bacterium]
MLDFSSILFFGLASVGLTAILVDGELFRPMRESFHRKAEKVRRNRELGHSIGWRFSEWASKILSCYQCCGFWCGLLCGILIFTPPECHIIWYQLHHVPRVHGIGFIEEWTWDPVIPYRAWLVFTPFLLCCGWTASLLSWLFVLLHNAFRAMMEYYIAITPRTAQPEEPQTEDATPEISAATAPIIPHDP